MSAQTKMVPKVVDLFGTIESDDDKKGLQTVSVGEIHIWENFRTEFDEEPLQDLAESIRTLGILQPLLVRPRQVGGYFLIAGERRLRAAKIVGMAEVPVVVRELSDAEAAAANLVENMQRRDISPMEEAAGFKVLIDRFGYTQEGLAGYINKSQAHVANRLRLLRLPEETQAMVRGGALSAGHGLALLVLEKAPEFLNEVAGDLVKEQVPVAQAQSSVRQAIRSDRKPLDKKSWGGPIFDVGVCRDCDAKVSIEAYGGGMDSYCLRPKCWTRKNSVAGTKLKEEQEAERKTQEEVRLEREAAKTGTGAELKLDPVQEILRKVGKVEPAKPVEGVDIEEARRLRTAGQALWELKLPLGGDYARECYLSLDQLLDHFTQRGAIGASQMPWMLHDVALAIPEQGISIKDRSCVPDPLLRLEQGMFDSRNMLRVHMERTDIIDTQVWATSMVYYRAEVSDLAGTGKRLNQQVVIPGDHRTIILTSSNSYSDNVTIRRELVPRWLKLVQDLPAFPEEKVE